MPGTTGRSTLRASRQGMRTARFPSSQSGEMCRSVQSIRVMRYADLSIPIRVERCVGLFNQSGEMCRSVYYSERRDMQVCPIGVERYAGLSSQGGEVNKVCPVGVER